MATVTLTQSSYSKEISLHRHPEWVKISEKTLAIANYYIPFHVRKCVNHESLRGLPKQFLVPPQQPCELFLFVAKLCTQMEETNSNFFNGLPEKVKIKNENAKSIFFGLCKETFSDNKINWGRIVSLFTLAGCLAVHFVNKHQLHVVQKIPLWLQEFVDLHLTEWIQEQGGWDDLQNKLSDSDIVSSWSKALALGGVVAAAGYLFFASAGLTK